MSFRSAFRTILTSAAGVNSLVSTRIYPAIIPDNVIDLGVCVAYHIADNDPTNHKSGASDLDFLMVDVDVVGKKILEVETAAEAVRVALENHHSSTGILRCVFMESDELYDDKNKLHRITMGFKTTYKRS